MTTNARGGDASLPEPADRGGRVPRGPEGSSRGLAEFGSPRLRAGAILGIALAAQLLTGCAAVPIHEQRLVSKPNLQFSRSSIYFYDARLLLQVQPGRFSNGGAQASTCTLCR